MKIAIDAMGGDYAPTEIVKGTVETAIAAPELELVLVGDKERIEKELGMFSTKPANISIFPSSEVIGMGDHPATAVRQKKDASVVVANRLVKEGKADAVVSAGSTGAAMAASLLLLGRVKGIKRPAIGTMIPTQKAPMLLLDAGANADVKPENLVQFAQMGSIYMEKVWQRKNPRVGLVNIGEEETKGNELVIAAHQALKKVTINFCGNIEGRDIPAGEVDVAVCDGFVGNIILKLLEGLAKSFGVMLKDAFTTSWRTKLGAALVLPGLRLFKQKLDPSEYGGAPLLGLKGVSIISHGSSNAKAIKNAIRVAKETIEADVVGKITERIREEKQCEE